MSRRCLICSNINPCREHNGEAQSAELDRNMRASAALQATPAPTEGLREALRLAVDALDEARCVIDAQAEPVSQQNVERAYKIARAALHQAASPSPAPMGEAE